jgi:hypothetical protein
MASNVPLFQCGACWKSVLKELQEMTWRKNFKQGKHMQVNIMVCIGEWLDII